MVAYILNRDLLNPEKRILTLGAHGYGEAWLPELDSMQKMLEGSNVQLIVCHALADMKKYLSTQKPFDAFGIRPVLPGSDDENRLGTLSVPINEPYQVLRMKEDILPSDADWIRFSNKIQQVPIFIQTLLTEDYSTVVHQVNEILKDGGFNPDSVTVSNTSNHIKDSLNAPLINWAKSLAGK